MLEVLVCSLAACASTQTPPPDPQQNLADASQSVAVAREAFHAAVVERTAPFWKLRVQYGEPGPACMRFGQLSPAEKQEKIARATREHGPLEKEWDRRHQINNRGIVRATILGGGLAGLGAALNARDEETVYASVAYQLWEVREGKIDLSRPECGFRYGDADTPDGCGVTAYHRNDNEAFCRFIIDDTSLKQFWGESNDGIMADDKIQEELDRAYNKYIVGHIGDNNSVDEARRRLSNAEDKETEMCESAPPFTGGADPKNIDECIHPEQAVRDSDEEMGPPELVKRYLPHSQ